MQQRVARYVGGTTGRQTGPGQVNYNDWKVEKVKCVATSAQPQVYRGELPPPEQWCDAWVDAVAILSVPEPSRAHLSFAGSAAASAQQAQSFRRMRRRAEKERKRERRRLGLMRGVLEWVRVVAQQKPFGDALRVHMRAACGPRGAVCARTGDHWTRVCASSVAPSGSSSARRMSTRSASRGGTRAGALKSDDETPATLARSVHVADVDARQAFC